MRCGRLFRRLFLPVLLAALASGCQALRTYRPVTVLARDAETQKLIPGAEVRIFYPLTPPQLAPANSIGTTGDDGTARLRAAPTEEGFSMETTAPGYLLDQKSLAGDVVAIPPNEPFQLFGRKEQPPVSLVAELYAEPGPTIELVLPSGYRGLVKVEVRPRDDVPCPPGQRRFRYEVPPSGDVEATGPALLRRLPNFVASYADGAPLSAKAKDDEVGLRWLSSDGVRETLVVGTLAEFYSYRRASVKEDAGTSPAGRRKGGHGHRPPSDPDGSNP